MQPLPAVGPPVRPLPRFRRTLRRTAGVAALAALGAVGTPGCGVVRPATHLATLHVADAARCVTKPLAEAGRGIKGRVDKVVGLEPRNPVCRTNGVCPPPAAGTVRLDCPPASAPVQTRSAPRRDPAAQLAAFAEQAGRGTVKLAGAVAAPLRSLGDDLGDRWEDGGGPAGMAGGIAADVADVLHSDERHYLNDADLNYYRDRATGLDAPAGVCVDPPELSAPPRTIEDALGGEIFDLTLDEAIRLTLTRTTVLRDQNQFLAVTNPLLSAPLAVTSIYDPAIQETAVGFNRGVEAALADFDAQYTSSLTWNRDEQVQNNVFTQGLAAGSTFVEESAAFDMRLQKNFATGGTVSLNHDVDYSGTNVFQSRLFPSEYRTQLGVNFRQPLLAGAGPLFNRVAGPNARQNRFLGNLDQGVLIARINTDQNIADFEREVRNLLRDVERAYWDLGASYRVFAAEQSALGATLETWRLTTVRANEGLPGGGAGDVALALDAVRDSQSRTETARADLFRAETSLRRLMNLPAGDGRTIRPVEEPVIAEFRPDWHAALADALVHRVELRRQKWEVKRLGLLMAAAENAALPQLDFVSGYRVNGFGDKLITYDDDDAAGTPQGLDSAYERLTQGDETGWTLGLEFSLPVGRRAQLVQIRNTELRLRKARATLSTQENDIGHELAIAFQDVARQYRLAEIAFNRLRSAQDRVETYEALADTPQANLDLLLRSQVVRAQAETQYWTAVYAYNQAIADVFLRQGTLLARDGVFLSEGRWTPAAYRQAVEQAWERSHATPAPNLLTTPDPFAVPAARPPSSVPTRPVAVPVPAPLPPPPAPVPADGDDAPDDPDPADDAPDDAPDDTPDDADPFGGDVPEA